MYTHSFSRAATKYKGESNFSSNARFPPENSTRGNGANYDQPTTSPTTSTLTPFSGQRIFMPPLTGDFWKISLEQMRGRLRSVAFFVTFKCGIWRKRLLKHVTVRVRWNEEILSSRLFFIFNAFFFLVFFIHVISLKLLNYYKELLNVINIYNSWFFSPDVLAECQSVWHFQSFGRHVHKRAIVWEEKRKKYLGNLIKIDLI